MFFLNRFKVRRDAPKIGLGTILGFASALGYTLANICLRSVTNCDPFWVTCVKALPTVLMVLPWVAWRVFQGQSIVRSRTDLVALIAASILAQVAGNVAFQWSLGIIGLALAVPFTLATILVGSTALGHWFLDEIVTKRTLVALLLVLVAVAVLSFGADDANRSITESQDIEQTVEKANVVLGVIVVCVAGFAYSILGATLRWARERGTPTPGVLFVTGLVGLIVLGGICLVQPGWEVVRQTSQRELSLMFCAGVFNALAFAALVCAMHLSGLVYVNALNASQTALAAIAGILFFNEAFSWPLLVGIPLTVIGLLMMKSTRRHSTTSEVANQRILK